VSDLTNHYIFIVGAEKENDQLKKKVSDLESTIFQLEELRKENERLKALMQFGAELAHKKILAQVVGKDSSGIFKVLRINKGLKDGIKIKSPVITSSGLVGHIYRSTDHFSDVLTILDPNNRVDVLVERTRSHGIGEGHTKSTMIMKYVPRTEPIKLHDLVITAGLGHIYPKGLKVGPITKIERESYGITQFIEISPSVDFSKLEEVAILISEQKIEMTEPAEDLYTPTNPNHLPGTSEKN
jgi:rod shape-determining protein MreC